MVLQRSFFSSDTIFCRVFGVGLEPRKKFLITVPSSTVGYDASVVEGGDLLVIVLFATTDEIRRFMMNPHYCCADVTFGTNNEKKHLFTLASVFCGSRFAP